MSRPRIDRLRASLSRGASRARAMTDARTKRRVPDDARIAQLELRVDHLEAALEGLQDSVHRESSRHEQQLNELERLTQPGAMAQSLSADARRRGI